MRLTLILISGSSFIFYGLLILVSGHMKQEFKRYKMENLRTFTGYLELAGGVGQLLGLIYPHLMAISSAGLAALMLFGTIIRIRTRDPWLEILPAVFLMLINIYIVLTELFYN